MSFIGIENARYIDPTGTLIDLELETDEGIIPFTFDPSDTAPATEYVRERLSGLEIAGYEAPPPPSLEELKAAKAAEMAAARFEAETAGIDGIKTDRESQALITGAALKAMQDSAYSCRWKTESGFVELSALQISAIADAVRAHVQSCFDREAELVALIEAAESPGELDEIMW